ncbi:hypothetical protein IJ425_04615 [bacterium]|nr:hypothetical protein [bacterium]
MKFNSIVRNLYDKYFVIAGLQKEFLDCYFKERLTNNFYLYESRIKTLESFALKIETGRNALEDFFACRFIVIKKDDIEKIKNDLQKNNIDIIESRPRDIRETSKLPENFSFDELRLYVKFNQPTNAPQKEFLNSIFEIQIMTLYSFVWAQTTHDLIYKGNDISWGKARIAYQIKALLEQAQYAIDTIEKTDDKYFPKNESYEKQKTLIQCIKTNWDEALLPKDLNRLSSNILKLVKNLNSNLDEMQDVLNMQIQDDNGLVPTNITPYQYILKSYFKHKPECLLALTAKKHKLNFQIALIEDLDIDEDIVEKLAYKEILKDYRKEFID